MTTLFERNENRVTDFLKWTDFKQSKDYIKNANTSSFAICIAIIFDESHLQKCETFVHFFRAHVNWNKLVRSRDLRPFKECGLY